MSVWSDCLLGDIANFRNGRSSPERTDGGAFPVFGSNGVIGFSDETNADLGTSIIGRVGSYCGSVYYSDTACWVTDNAIAGEPKEAKADGRFLYYLLKKLDLNRAAQGSGQPLLNQSILNLIELTVPSDVEEQEAIAEVLSSLDEKIELNRKQNRTLEAIAQALFKRWFVEFEFPDENGRPYKSSGGAMQPSELGEIPVGWEVGDIYRIANVTYGFPFKSESFNESGVGVPLIRIRDLKNDSTGLFTTESADARYLVSAGDVLVGMDAEFRPHVWKGVDSFLNQRVCKFSPRNASVHEYFILRSIVPWLVYFEHAKTGTTVIHLGKGDIDQFECVVPTDEVLRGFYEVIDPIYRKLVSNSVESRTLAKLRDTLLPKLMSGELRVSEAADLAEAMP